MLMGLLLSALAGAEEIAKPAAPTSADPWASIEEMVVIGTGGVEVLLDAPISVVAFDNSALLEKGIHDIGNLSAYTPNLEINSPYAASNPQLFIRGVGLQDSNANASAAVAVVVDNIYLNSPAGQLAGLFDVESVEVLRGPQGAIYGRNASAGVVRVTSARPVHEAKAGANLTYGRFNQLEVDGFINVPVVTDKLATRFAFKYTARDPLGENRCATTRDVVFPVPTNRINGTKCFQGMVTSVRPNSPIALPPKNTHNRKNWFARSQTLIEPTDGLSFLVKFHGGQNLGLAPQFQNRGINPVKDLSNNDRPDLRVTAKRYLDYDTCHRFAPNGDCLRNDRFAGAGDPFSGDYSRGGKERLTLGGIALNSTWTDGPWTFTSATGLDYNDREVVIDFDASPFVEADSIISDTAWQVIEDGKLVWDEGTGLALTIGGQYFHEELKADNLFWNSPFTALAQKIDQTTDAAAAFGFVKYELSETVTFEGGARVNYERKNLFFNTAYKPFQLDQFFPPIAGYVDGREIAEMVRPSGEVIMRYEPTDDVQFYAKFTRGIKGRHFNGNALTKLQSIAPVESESVNSYEMGWKTSWLDGLVNWTGAAFYYDYEDQQVYVLQTIGVSPPVPVLNNAKDSRLIGMESDLRLTWEGIEWFNSVGFIYSEYSDYKIINSEADVSTDGVVTITREVKDYSGNSLVNAPQFTLVGSLKYDWALPWGGTLTPLFDYRYKSQVFYSPENDSRIGADPRWIFDMRLDYRTPDGNIVIGGWIRNLTDQFYPVTAYDRKKRVASIVYVVSEPRTFGFTVSYQY